MGGSANTGAFSPNQVACSELRACCQVRDHSEGFVGVYGGLENI